MSRTAHTRPRRLMVGVALTAAASCALLLTGCSSREASSPGLAEPAGGLVKADQESQVGSAPDNAANDRQIVQTGTLTLVVTHPTAAADDVVAAVEQVGGRVDSRSQHEAGDDQPESAWLTVRVPTDQVDATITAFGEIGRVSDLSIQAEDVTAAAEDLDARIAAQEVSVARMTDVLNRAVTTSDVVAAEEALLSRQSDLEQMQSERARLADQVALSTLQLSLETPAVVQTGGATTFGSAVAAGWHSLVRALTTGMLVVGVLLPWLAFMGAIAGFILLVVRVVQRRRRNTSEPESTPAPN